MIKNSNHYKELYSHIPISRYISAILGYAMYFGTNFCFLLILPFLLVPILLSKTIRNFFFIKAYRFYLHFLTRTFLPLVKVYEIIEESDLPAITSGKPAIFIANHRSRLDGPIILSGLKETGVIMKSSYARLPIFSLFVKHGNFISVDSSSIDLLQSAMQKCKELLKNGKNLLIFPEGSRSRSSKLLPFKELAFRLSIETNTPIIPVVIHTDYPLMAKIENSLFPPSMMKLTVRALSPIYSEPNERSTDYADRVRKTMVKEIKKLDANTIWEYL